MRVPSVLAVLLLLLAGCATEPLEASWSVEPEAPPERSAEPRPGAAPERPAAPPDPPPGSPPSPPDGLPDPPVPARNGTDGAEPPAGRPYVVVATFDTGVNPYHPAWRTEETLPTWLPGYGPDVRVDLSLGDVPGDDRAASSAAWDEVLGHDGGLVAFNGTRVIGARAATSDPTPFYDAEGNAHMHGARASSQIAGTGYAVADHAFVVTIDHAGGGSGETYHAFIRTQMEWILQQPWIDIIHVNMAFPAPFPLDGGQMELFSRAVDEGKLVVLAGGNGLGNGGPPFPMELQDTTGAPGTLVAGANDQCAAGGYWSNLNPHVVMDGAGTVAAHETTYGDAVFSGTSSASPRIAGYAAELLYQVRLHHNVTRGLADGALVVLPEDAEAPSQGPLADGRLTAHELHEVIRKTARWPHDAELDGTAFAPACPGVPDAGVPLYAKYGYGEVGTKTLPDALAVVLGQEPMPERSHEDRWFGLSETVRETLHG